MKFKNFFKKQQDYKIKIRTQATKIKQLEETIEGIIEEQKYSYGKQSLFHDQALVSRESELKDEFKLFTERKNAEVDGLKIKITSGRDLFDAIREKRAELEKVRVDIFECMKLSNKYQDEATKWQKVAIEKITTFEKGFDKIEERAQAKLDDFNEK